MTRNGIIESAKAMHIDRHLIEEYPFSGEFYRSVIDRTLPLEQQVETEVVVLATECDITEASHSRLGDFSKAAYAVYVPFDKTLADPIEVNRGLLFRASDYGVPVDGKVTGVFPSQVGGFVAYVDVSDV